MNDRERLKHMLEAAYEATKLAEGQSRTSLDENRSLLYGLAFVISIIGEAASRVSREFQDEHTQVEWAKIVGMRNRLIHGYFSINLDLIWDTVEISIPDLIAKLENLLANEGE